LAWPCSPLCNAIEWTINRTVAVQARPVLVRTFLPRFGRGRGCSSLGRCGLSFPARQSLKIFFIALDRLVYTRHRGGTPVETGISPANLTSGRTSVRTIIPNTGKAEFQEGGPILENGACRPWPAAVAAPSDRSGAATPIRFPLSLHLQLIEQGKRHGFADDQAAFNTAPSGMTP
jgi:hypothetical protein